MLTTSKIAVALALALGTASVATAATRHPVHNHRAAIERQVPAPALQSYGYVRGPQRSEPGYMAIQDEDYARSNGFR